MYMIIVGVRGGLKALPLTTCSSSTLSLSLSLSIRLPLSLSLHTHTHTYTWTTFLEFLRRFSDHYRVFGR
ncbi:hypothetical protein HanXRQr2_Chr02g0082891 [Helianthus annuus]|uniref:Uncharacterized protein n=1 Tax=Helianthus annuus TaxID=4232 RepID=A0A251VJH7_HELAN|nr:hypothetical protein HanXRQr2_Chr02g0082891 [Helianthus annuus]KAJ0953117.1 hypothetical protein HanPSC8_Chr02g0080261 [Helianthus annuus]